MHYKCTHRLRAHYLILSSRPKSIQNDPFRCYRVYLTRSSQGLHLRKSLSLHDSSSATYGCPLPSSAYASTGKAARHHLLGSIAGRLISSSFICPPHWPMGKRLLSSPPGWIGWPRLVSRPKAPAQSKDAHSLAPGCDAFAPLLPGLMWPFLWSELCLAHGPSFGSDRIQASLRDRAVKPPMFS